MSRPTTTQLAALLTAWRNGSELLDTLGPRTDAMLAQLVSAPKPVECQPIDTAQMSDSELRAHYAKTAHVEDIRFHVRLLDGLVGAHVTAWRELLATVEANNGKATPTTKARYWALVQASRERHAALDARSSEAAGVTGWAVLTPAQAAKEYGYKCPSLVRKAA